MIKSIHLPSLRNSEILQFFKDAVACCVRSDAEALNLKEPVGAMQTEITNLNDVLKKEQGSSKTEELIKHDARRDSSITGIKTVCEGYTYNEDKNISDAANLILESIKRYGQGIARLNYQAETTILSNLTKEWKETPELEAALKLLHLWSWVLLLEEQNNMFSDTYLDRVDEKVASASISFSESRTQAINCYRALSDTIFAYYTINKTDDYKNLIELINVVVDDYNSILAKREANKEEEVENE